MIRGIDKLKKEVNAIQQNLNPSPKTYKTYFTMPELIALEPFLLARMTELDLPIEILEDTKIATQKEKEHLSRVYLDRPPFDDLLVKHDSFNYLIKTAIFAAMGDVCYSAGLYDEGQRYYDSAADFLKTDDRKKQKVCNICGLDVGQTQNYIGDQKVCHHCLTGVD